MTQKQMSLFIRDKYPVTFNGVKVVFYDGTHDVGFFTEFDENINISNKWRFVSNNSSPKYQSTKSLEYTKIIDGEKVKQLILL
jgi:hypothetical protein